MLERTLSQPKNQRDSIMLAYDPEDMLPVRKSEEDLMNIPPESDGTENKTDQEVGDEKNSRYEELDTWVWVVLVIFIFFVPMIGYGIFLCCWDRCYEGGVPVRELDESCLIYFHAVQMNMLDDGHRIYRPQRYQQPSVRNESDLNEHHPSYPNSMSWTWRSESELSELNKAKDRLQKIQKLNKANDRLQKIYKLIDEVSEEIYLDATMKKIKEIKDINMDTKTNQIDKLKETIKMIAKELEKSSSFSNTIQKTRKGGELIDEVVCPICYFEPKTEEFPCDNNHHYCPACIKEIPICSMCREPKKQTQLK